MSILSRASALAFSAGKSAGPRISPTHRWLGTLTRSTSRHSVVLSNSANLPLMNSAHFGTFYLPSSLLRVTPILTQQRQFASPRGRRPTPNKKQSNVLANEKLIAVIMSKHTNTPPNEVMVRLVIDEGPENPATVSVVSLSEAIEVSVARNKDLIGTSLQSDPPVIRATDISKMEYRQQQSQQKGIAKSKTQKKTIRFRAGISDHDLERKMEGLMKFLDQGLECDYSVFSKKKLLRVNAEAGMDLVERIQVLLADHATLKRPPQPNELKNYVRVNLVPKKNAKV